MKSRSSDAKTRNRLSDGQILPADVEELDAGGLLCPEPVMLLHKRMRELPEGACLRLIATDTSTLRDVPDFCRHLGHQLLAQGDGGESLWFLLRKGSS